MFTAFALYITSFVSNINHFNFYFTGFITPMFFFSGMVFPLDIFPKYLQIAAELLPLTHSVRIIRAFCFNELSAILLIDMLYIFLFTTVFGYLAIRRLARRIIT